MRIDIVNTIKKTLEETKDITILSLNEENDILFGVYINNVEGQLSFLSRPKTHFETVIGNVNIQFFELGAVLYNIYFYGALKFIDILCPNDNLIKPNQYYMELCDFVLENIPFNVAKLKYIEAIDKDFKYENDKEKVQMLLEVMLGFQSTLLGENEDFTYIKIENENDFINVCNQLNYFKQKLQEKTFSKISEKNMNQLDDMYINLQISHI